MGLAYPTPPDVLPSIIEASKNHQVALVPDHPVSRPRSRAPADGQLLPLPRRSIKTPKVAVVAEALARGAGEFPAKNEEEGLVHDGLVGAPGRRTGGAGAGCITVQCALLVLRHRVVVVGSA